MNRSTYLAILILLPLLAACAGKPDRPEAPDGYFATHIEEDGTRKFQYTLDVADGDQRAGGRPGNVRGHAVGSSSRGVSGGISAGTGGGKQRPASSGYEAYQRINKLLEVRLEEELGKSGFCPNGHRETQRVVEPGLVYIRGECKAAAGQPDTE